MPVDAGIYGQIQPVQIESPVNALAKAYQVKNMQNHNRLADMQIAGADRELAAQNALAEAYRGATTPEGTVDRTKLTTSLAQGGQGARIPGIQKGFADADKAEFAARTEKLTGALKTLDVVAQNLAPTLTNPAMYPQVRAALAQQYPEGAATLPEQFDPQAIKSVVERSLSTKDRLATQLAREKFDYDQKNDAANRGVTMRGQNMTDARMRDALSQKNSGQGDGKPLPAPALKLVQEDLDAIGTASSINADLGTVLNQVNSGKLDFGPTSNLLNKARNATGMSNEESRNFASFQNTLEKLRNDSLRLNKGVQTDGDAQRAWNELFTNINDKNVVKQRLQEIQKINERAVNLRKNSIDSVRANYGKAPMDTSSFENQPSALGGGSSNIDSLLDKYK